MGEPFLNARGWNVERLSARVWKAVEEDPFGQYPFVYLVLGWDKIAVIDTGTGANDPTVLFQAIPQIRDSNLPFILLLTHCHFDHIGGIKYLQHQQGCLGICMSGRDKKFTEGYEINSLAMAHHGASVSPFQVTRWLREGDTISLDDMCSEAQLRQKRTLHVLETPGHTPDSCAYYFPQDQRIFVGDTIYPYTAIHLDCIGSNVSDYFETLNKLVHFVKKINAEQKIEKENIDVAMSSTQEKSAKNGSSPTTTKTRSQAVQSAVEQFLAVTALDEKEITQKFNLDALLSFCDYSVEAAIDMYFNSSADLPTLFPPHTSSVSQSPVSSLISSPEHNDTRDNTDLCLSCGHVAENLSPSTLDELIVGLNAVRRGIILPSHIVDSEYGEYTVGDFSLILPLKQ